MRAKTFHLKFTPGTTITVYGQIFKVVSGRVLSGRQLLKKWSWEEWELHDSSGNIRWISYSLHEGLLFLAEVTAKQLPNKNAKHIPYQGKNYRVTDRIKASIVHSTGPIKNSSTPTHYLSAELGNQLLSLEIQGKKAELFIGKPISKRVIES